MRTSGRLFTFVALTAGAVSMALGQSASGQGGKGKGGVASAESIKVAKDFKVELLYRVPNATQGSWVSMCVDPQGRLITSDQGGAGLYLVTPPPLGGKPEDTRVEKLPTPLSAAQGLLWAFDSLYVVVNGGGGMNFGGTSKHGAMTARLVPAVHSTLAGFPAAAFMLDIGGTRVYISGDTDLYGDMKTIGERYQPNLAIVCVGDGPFTMGPEEAARACQWLGVSHAIPVHYAHNPLVRGVEAGEEFRKAMAQIARSVQVSVMKRGESQLIQT